MAEQEKVLEVMVVCPERDGFKGFGSAGRWFSNGSSKHQLPESVVKQMQAEIAAKGSILGVAVLGEVKPSAAK